MHQCIISPVPLLANYILSSHTIVVVSVSSSLGRCQSDNYLWAGGGESALRHREESRQ